MHLLDKSNKSFNIYIFLIMQNNKMYMMLITKKNWFFAKKKNFIDFFMKFMKIKISFKSINNMMP